MKESIKNYIHQFPFTFSCYYILKRMEREKMEIEMLIHFPFFLTIPLVFNLIYLQSKEVIQCLFGFSIVSAASCLSSSWELSFQHLFF
jgi:hypothetical protein